MSVSEKQRAFMKCVGLLLQKIDADGYEVTGDWLYRPAECAEHLAAAGKGIRNSLHTQRLAIDLNLFFNGVYQTTTAAHEPFGDYWESLHPDARWGGRFGDGNHYSFQHGGRR